MKTAMERAVNFNAGPAVLPVSVLERAREEMLNYENTGMSVMEMSHRSKAFEGILDKAIKSFRKVMGIPENYDVLFLQGGASLQFSMIPMNLYQEGRPVDFIHTGHWVKKAIEEADKVAKVRIAASTEAEKFRRLPRAEEIKIDPNASYAYLCSNNTIEGTEWRDFPSTGEVPLVADMSSDILSHRVDVNRFAMIFAGAQKNLGPSGVTVVILRKDLVERGSSKLPTMLQYRTHSKNNSLYNTPPTFGIYIVGLVLDWIDSLGGLAAMERINEEKARILYNAIDAGGFYYCPVEKKDRSWMNVVYRIKGDNEALEKKFVDEAKSLGMVGLQGHRAVGGLRASIYNALPVEGVRTLVDFMKDFQRKNG